MVPTLKKLGPKQVWEIGLMTFLDGLGNRIESLMVLKAGSRNALIPNMVRKRTLTKHAVQKRVIWNWDDSGPKSIHA